GTLGLNLVDNDSIKDIDSVPLSGTGTDGAHDGIAPDGSKVGEVYTLCTPPSFTACPGPTISTNTDPGVCTASVSYTATASGTPTPTLSYTFTGATVTSGSGTGSGSAFNKGTTTVTITAHNGCSSDAMCSFSVTVTDDQAPVITAPNVTAKT